ncbi:MAG: hypothetical protein H7A53_00870 [Akkermansiaceae bacterium]|nr:hypothetical protein [Akkermansiaceae bacterium]
MAITPCWGRSARVSNGFWLAIVNVLIGAELSSLASGKRGHHPKLLLIVCDLIVYPMFRKHGH